VDGSGSALARLAGCGSAWHVDEWTKLLPGGRERTFSLRHGGFGRCHGAVGLMLVGTGQVTGLQTLADIGRDAANVVELAARGIEFHAGALPRPPALADGGCHAQLGRRGAALDGTPFGIGQGLAAAAFARQPQRDRHADLVLAGAEVAVQAVRLGGQLHRHRFGRQRSGRLLLRACRVASRRQRLGFGLPRPGGFEGRTQRGPVLNGGRCRSLRVRLDQSAGQCSGECQGQGGAGGVLPPPGSQESSSVHPMLQC
jgi:hypothetical protein